MALGTDSKSKGLSASTNLTDFQVTRAAAKNILKLFYMLFFASALTMAMNTSSKAVDYPEDTAKSVLWSYIAEDFILSDKEGGQKIVMDDSILVQVPKVAEDQMVVPVHVDARAIKNVKKIVVFADLNPLPKVLTFVPKKAEARLSFRIKVEQGTVVRAAVLDGDNVWRIGATYLDATGGGCSQPAIAHGTDDWITHLAEVRAKIWRKPTSEAAKMRVTIKHPMDTGLADGIPAYYIEKLDMVTPQGDLLGQVFLHEPVSENPTLTLFPKLNASTNSIILQGRDTEGTLIKVKVPAPIEAS